YGKTGVQDPAVKLPEIKNRRPQSRPNYPRESVKEIVPHQLLEELVPVQLTDQAAGVVVVGDIGRVLREQIPDDLIDGVIALFAERPVYRGENGLHLLG